MNHSSKGIVLRNEFDNDNANDVNRRNNDNICERASDSS